MQSDPTTEQVRTALEEAAAMVAALPENLQTAAFNRAFDALIGGRTTSRGTATRPAKARAHRTREGRPSLNAGEDAPDLSQLLKNKHPEIRSGRKAIDLALLVLRAARDDCKVDWLTPGQIADVLRSRFMVKVTMAAIRMALWGNEKYIDRKPLPGGGKKYAYCLMAAGDDYIDRLHAAEREREQQNPDTVK